jgi:hypothetical protein
VTAGPELEVDAERAQVSGPGALVRALIGGDADGPDLPDAPPQPLLDAGLAAARAPAARLRVTGLPAPVDGFADQRAAALLLPLDGDRLVLRACTPSGLLGLLVRLVGLRPRPRHAADGDIALPAAGMAAVLRDRSAAAAPTLADETRATLQAHLDALAAHWRIELYGPGAGDGPVGWYLEVLDSERGLWAIEDAPDGTLTLRPTDATAVLDEIAALPGHVGLGPAADA